MIVDLLALLRSAGAGLLEGTALGPLEGYAARSAPMLGLTLSVLAEQLDGAAAAWSEENAALRALFADAAPRLADTALAARAARAGAEAASGLRLSQLREQNDALRALLIEVHAALEVQQDAAARALLDRIWSELVRSTERRAVSLAPF